MYTYVYSIVYNMHCCPVFSESLLGFGVSSGEVRDSMFRLNGRARQDPDYAGLSLNSICQSSAAWLGGTGNNTSDLKHVWYVYCVYIYIYIYICLRICIYVCICTCMCIYMYIYIYTHICMMYMV